LVIEFEVGPAGFTAGGIIIGIATAAGAIAVPAAPASTGAAPFSFK